MSSQIKLTAALTFLFNLNINASAAPSCPNATPNNIQELRMPFVALKSSSYSWLEERSLVTLYFSTLHNYGWKPLHDSTNVIVKVDISEQSTYPTLSQRFRKTLSIKGLTAKPDSAEKFTCHESTLFESEINDLETGKTSAAHTKMHMKSDVIKKLGDMHTCLLSLYGIPRADRTYSFTSNNYPSDLRPLPLVDQVEVGCVVHEYVAPESLRDGEDISRTINAKITLADITTLSSTATQFSLDYALTGNKTIYHPEPIGYTRKLLTKETKFCPSASVDTRFSYIVE